MAKPHNFPLVRFCTRCGAPRPGEEGFCQECRNPEFSLEKTITYEGWVMRQLKVIEAVECACGCKRLVRRWSHNGAEQRYVRGHNMRTPATLPTYTPEALYDAIAESECDVTPELLYQE